MNKRTFVNAQAYYGDPVSGQRQTLVAGVRQVAGGVPFGEEPVVVVSAPDKRPAKGKKKG